MKLNDEHILFRVKIILKSDRISGWRLRSAQEYFRPKLRDNQKYNNFPTLQGNIWKVKSIL